MRNGQLSCHPNQPYNPNNVKNLLAKYKEFIGELPGTPQHVEKAIALMDEVEYDRFLKKVQAAEQSKMDEIKKEMLK